MKNVRGSLPTLRTAIDPQIQFQPLVTCTLFIFFFFCPFNLLLGSRENNNNRGNNLTIVSSPPIMHLNLSYSWTDCFSISTLNHVVLFFLPSLSYILFLLPYRCMSCATIFATGTSAV